jgi:hypothetical protein
MAATAANILASLRYDFDAFKREATEIRETLADAQGAYYFMSLYALLMGVFSQVDLYAALLAGSIGKGQTKRMRDFLNRYSGRDPFASMLAVQLYRHTLMHTSRPRLLLDETTGRTHAFLLHWGRKRADAAAHYTVDADGKLTLNLESLVEDVSRMLDAFIADATADSLLNAQIEALWQDVMVQRFRS